MALGKASHKDFFMCFTSPQVKQLRGHVIHNVDISLKVSFVLAIPSGVFPGARFSRQPPSGVSEAVLSYQVH
jgi:hypothetical protein